MNVTRLPCRHCHDTRLWRRPDPECPVCRHAGAAGPGEAVMILATCHIQDRIELVNARAEDAAEGL